MNKGDTLKGLLDRKDELNLMMNSLFLKHGMTTPELNLLPDADREKWMELYKVSMKVTDEICELINNEFQPEKI